jgi:hypothetical protein
MEMARARDRSCAEDKKFGVSSTPNFIYQAERVGFEPTVARKDHNGFRDRPVQPLRHLSPYRDAIIARAGLDFHFRPQFGVLHLIEALLLNAFHQCCGGFRFAVYQENPFQVVFGL